MAYTVFQTDGAPIEITGLPEVLYGGVLKYHPATGGPFVLLAPGAWTRVADTADAVHDAQLR